MLPQVLPTIVPFLQNWSFQKNCLKDCLLTRISIMQPNRMAYRNLTLMPLAFEFNMNMLKKSFHFVIKLYKFCVSIFKV